jgi:hypothetical protein
VGIRGKGSGRSHEDSKGHAAGLISTSLSPGATKEVIGVLLELPCLYADTFQLFVDALAQAFPDSFNILLLDNSGAYTAQRIRWPANVQPVWLPRYCPELNPIARVWRDVKDDLAWQQFVALRRNWSLLGTYCRLMTHPPCEP